MGVVKKTVTALRANPRNPRKITEKKADLLGHSMEEHGDISGVVFNVRTGFLVGGNQRSKKFDDKSTIVITEKFKKPTRTGTVALGYIEHEGERFSYREVNWNKHQETAAMIAANNNAGTWDSILLKSELKELSSFDAGIDIETTMFDEDDLSAMGVGAEEGDSASGNEPDKEATPDGAPSKLVHECPRCGYEFR